MIFLSGRILNRFAKDMGSVDEILPKIILDSSQVGSSRNDIMIGNVCICSMYHLIYFSDNSKFGWISYSDSLNKLFSLNSSFNNVYNSPNTSKILS